jgi:hypothetical protein
MRIKNPSICLNFGRSQKHQKEKSLLFLDVLFPGPQATSSLKDVLHDPRVDLLLPKKIFPSP